MSNIEEDIYNVKELLQGSKLYGQYDGNKYFKSIENILSEREQDKKRIKELEEESKSKQKAYDNCYCGYKQYKQFDSIPVQKVKDKIEELKKEYEDSKDENGESEYYYPDYAIRKLEELLNDK